MDAWVFDVDGTIVDAMNGQTLRPLTRELFAALRDRDQLVVLWSAGGAEHAERKADEHGLSDLVSACFGKRRASANDRWDVRPIESRFGVAAYVDDLGHELPEDATVVRVLPYLGGAPHDRGLVTVAIAAGVDLPGLD